MTQSRPSVDAEASARGTRCLRRERLRQFADVLHDLPTFLGLTRFAGRPDYAACAALWWWILASYSTGVRNPNEECNRRRLKKTSM